MTNKEFKRHEINLELWCSWLSRLLYTQKVLGSNPSSSTFFYLPFLLSQLILSYQLVSLISLLWTPLIHFPSGMIFEHISHNNDAIVIFLCVIRAKNKNPVPSLQNQKYCINLITLKKQLNLFYVGMQLSERLLSPCDINKESSKKFISLLWQELISRKR